jgi:hypothetical protein
MLVFRRHVLRTSSLTWVHHIVRHNGSVAPKPIKLPRLPIPPLEKTLERYLRSIEPLLLEDAARGGVPFAVASQQQAERAQAFLVGPGTAAQAELIGASTCMLDLLHSIVRVTHL